MSSWKMLLLAFAFFSCAAAFKVAKVEPKVIISIMMMMAMLTMRMVMMVMMRRRMMMTMTAQPKLWPRVYKKQSHCCHHFGALIQLKTIDNHASKAVVGVTISVNILVTPDICGWVLGADL